MSKKKEQEIVQSPLNSKWRDKNTADKTLMADIEANGQLQSLLARELPGGNIEVIAGHRRFLAMKALGIKPENMKMTVRKNVSDIDAVWMALSENQVRQDLTSIEEARAFASLVKLKMKIADIAKKLGKSESFVRERLSLLELPEEVQQMVVHSWKTLGQSKCGLKRKFFD